MKHNNNQKDTIKINKYNGREKKNSKNDNNDNAYPN